MKVGPKIRMALLAFAFIMVLSPAAWAVTSLTSSAAAGHPPHDLEVADVAGWTRHATSNSYLLIISVMPATEMYTAKEVAEQHLIRGEVIVSGRAVPPGEDIRHVEVHIYNRATGALLDTITPVITVVNQSTGKATEVDPVLMDDIEVGSLDRHFGNNVHIPANSDLRIEVSVNGEKVTVDGHLA